MYTPRRITEMKSLLESRLPSVGEFVIDHGKAIMLYINNEYDIEIIINKTGLHLSQVYLWEHREPFHNGRVIKAANTYYEETPKAVEQMYKHAMALSAM